MTGETHQCTLPHPDGRRSSFTCNECGSQYELIYTGFWGVSQRALDALRALGRKLKGHR